MLSTINYLTYITLSIGITVFVARTLSTNGLPFLVEGFGGNEVLARSTNHLLVVGFYLINFGYMSLALKLATKVATATEAFEAVSYKVGLVLVVLGVMHFFNLFVFSRIRAHKALADAPRPLPPDATLPAAE